jgi:uncharacterized protein YecE (DUF72 family)
VELNNSFYRQPPRERFEAWALQAPPGFLFAVKGSRYISHIRRLLVEQRSVDWVVDSARGLGNHLGPILFQFQDTFQCELARLDAFLPMLPDDVRFTLEFRHASWFTKPVFERLRDKGIALCIPDHPKLPQSLEVTTDFTYVRMHQGAKGVGYSRTQLETWAARIAKWHAEGITVFVYFNNDPDGHAIRDAKRLTEMLGRDLQESGNGKAGIRTRGAD